MQARCASRALLGTIAMVLSGHGAIADEVGVVGTKLVIVDKLATAGKAKLVFVSKDPVAGGIHKGPAADPPGLEGTVRVFPLGDPANRAELGLADGTDGSWLINKDTVAKYVNKAAGTGGLGVKVAVIKPGKVLKVVSKNLGDGDATTGDDGPFDLDPAAVADTDTMRVVVTVTNLSEGGGTSHVMCSDFTDLIVRSIAGGTGTKIVSKSSAGPSACGDGGGSSTTTSTSTSTTTTTQPSLTCCTLGSGTCGWALDGAECVGVLGGTPGAAGTVCNGATGGCDDPPAVPSTCCANLGPALGLSRGFCLASFPSNFNCVISGGSFQPTAVCQPDGICASPTTTTTSTTLPCTSGLRCSDVLANPALCTSGTGAFCNELEAARWNELEICMIDFGSSLDVHCDTAECEFRCALEDVLCPCECLDDEGCREDGVPLVCASEYAACVGSP